MSADIRVIVIAAAGAAFLSALTGIISQVAFGALMLRAVLSGLGFAALAAGLSMLIRRFLPEVFGGTSSAESSENPSASTAPEARDPEHRLNIVLPGEGMESPSDVESLPAAVEPSDVGAADLRDFEREAEEIGADSLVPQGGEERDEPVNATARPPSSFEDLDVLPDLDGLSDVFSSAAHGEMDTGEPPAKDPISTTGASRDGVDAVTMAQAVRTLLKRDQKG